MAMRIGINGMGRIGRALLRVLREDPVFAPITVVAVNDPAPKETLIHLLRHDSVMGPWRGEARATAAGVVLDGREVAWSGFDRPDRIPWREHGVDYVIEASGQFIAPDQAAGHLVGGAGRVIISALAGGPGVPTLVMGVNEGIYDPRHHRVVSNASCTTNCLAPVVKVILERFGVERGLMTTVHSYTNDQKLVDSPHPNLRRARAAGLSMIPTKTGAARALGLVIPALEGRFDGLAVRVPTPDVSLVDVVLEMGREASADEVNQALREAAGRYLGFTDEPLVSVDFLRDPHSAIIDGPTTRVIGRSAKILAWYDNEWGYSNRVMDLVLHMAAREG